jgi:phosphohistidine phosphatase
MKLYFLRHAIAVLRGTPGYEKDELRPLTPKGRKKMARIAKGMKALNLKFDAILSSPYLRAKSTAEIVASTFKLLPKLFFVESLIPEGDPKTLIAYLQKNFKDAESLLLVGHEPYLTHLISMLLCGSENLPIELKKGGLCKLTVNELTYGRCATLNWLLAPKQLVRLD